jgi:eukaryotic-like serine/threonine-protein kinase
MSDFLNKFSKQDYKENKDEPKKNEDSKTNLNETVFEIEKPIETIKDDIRVEQKVAEKVVSRPRASHQEPEEVHIDPSYKRNQRKRLIIGAVSVVLLLVVSFGAYYLLNQVQIPDYMNKPFSELKTWASRNNIVLETDYQFSLDVSKDYVIEMEPLANSNIQKGSILRVIVSNGADPDELIQVPDFTGNSYGQISEWLNANKINNLRITYENNEDIPVNEFVKIVFNDKTITSDTYTRKDYGLIYISNGPVVYEKNIEVPDWTTTNANVGVVEAWGLEKDVTIVVRLVNSSTVPMNGVINQSVSPKSMISKKSTITVSVSLGQVVVVPDFSKMSKQEAESVNLNNAIVKYVEMYQPKTGATFGSYIWQDVKAGTNVNQSSTTKLIVTVYFSKGQPYLSSMVDSSESLIPEKMYELNLDSAKFTYTINYVNSVSTKGTIVSMTPSNQFVDPGQHIVFEVSNGIAP